MYRSHPHRSAARRPAAAGLLAALACLSASAPALSQEPKGGAGAAWAWSPRAPLPTVKGASAAVRCGNEIYVLGGADNYAGNALSGVVQVYRPATDTWRTVSSVPDVSTFDSLGVDVGGKIYLIGGWSGGAYLCREYDPELDLWQYRAPPPQPLKWGHAGAAVDGRIYVVWYFLHCYEPAIDQWTTGYAAPLTYGYGMSAVALGGKIYVVGTGDELQVYDPATDVWTYGPDLPVETYAAATAVVDGKLYVMGGSLNYSQAASLDAVQVYDPATGTWDLTFSLPQLRYWACAAGHRDELFHFGGFDSGNTATPEVWSMPLRKD